MCCPSEQTLIEVKLKKIAQFHSLDFNLKNRWAADPEEHWPTDRESVLHIRSKWHEDVGDARQELVLNRHAKTRYMPLKRIVLTTRRTDKPVASSCADRAQAK